MGKFLAKCCKLEEEEMNDDSKTTKNEDNKQSQIKDKEMTVENLDKSDLPLTARQNKSLIQPNLENLAQKNKEKVALLEEKNEENETKEVVPFETKSNNFQEVPDVSMKNQKPKGNSDLIQELREINKSQIALLKSKQNVLPNQIDETIENEDKNKKFTDIFNEGSARKEKEEPERPPKIEEEQNENEEENE